MKAGRNASIRLLMKNETLSKAQCLKLKTGSPVEIAS